MDYPGIYMISDILDRVLFEINEYPLRFLCFGIAAKPGDIIFSGLKPIIKSVKTLENQESCA